MCNIRGLTVCGLMLAALAAAPARGQDPILAHYYGSGVHNYYEGDWSQAMDNLSVAIEGRTDDPRPYYYRGLTHLRMGNTAAADSDFRRGAELESADVNQAYPVGRSLERLQGAQRMQLERYRAKARAQAYARQVRRDAERYEQLRRSESQVLRQAPLGPPPAPLRPPGTVPAAAVAPAVPPSPAAAPAPGAPAPGEAPAPAAEPDPFDAPAGEAPAADMPAEAPAEAPPAEAPAAEPAAPADDPFSTSEAPAAGDAPAAKGEMKEAENPFGDEPK